MRIIREKQEVWPFILISLILHAGLAVALMLLMKAPRFQEDDLVEVFQVIEPETKHPYRIADIAKPAQERKPDNPKFLGMYDSAVKQEMVGTGRTGTAGGPTRGDKQVQGKKTKSKVAKKSKPKPQPRGRVVKKKGKDRLMAFDKSIFDQKEVTPKSESGGALDDFYPDFRRGPNTYLNVLRYPGVTYFVRMKRAFKIAFNPEPALRSHFAFNRVTRGSVDVVMGVTVGSTGELAELFIFRSSGIAAYDEEALRTVRVSAPFAKPPEKFLDDDGVLRMSWTFSVYL